MEAMTSQSHRETMMMKVVTLVTFAFLPATFVSVSCLKHQLTTQANSYEQTFFSTDVVKYQNGGNGPDDASGGGTSYSSLAMVRWLEVTIPLTVVTFLLSWIAYTKARENIGLHVLTEKAFGKWSFPR